VCLPVLLTIRRMIAHHFLDEARDEADSNRLIPPHNGGAEDPADVYPLHGIIPEAEWKAVSISALTHAKDDREARALLPYRRSNWVNQHLNTTLAADMPRKRNL
jgi:DNA-directed RNA polymerase I subunit RPA49